MNANFYLATWIFVFHFQMGLTTDELVCKLLQTIVLDVDVEPTPTDKDLQVCLPPLTTQCCRWNPDTEEKETTCCPEDGKCPDSPIKYDKNTCNIPQCYKMSSKREKCTEKFFMSKVQVQFGSDARFPVGANGVIECCEMNKNKCKSAAECCIRVNGEPKCSTIYEVECTEDPNNGESCPSEYASKRD